MERQSRSDNPSHFSHNPAGLGSRTALPVGVEGWTVYGPPHSDGASPEALMWELIVGDLLASLPLED